jgi:hypothetical protein
MPRSQVRIAKEAIHVEVLTDSERNNLSDCLKIGTIEAGTVFRFTPSSDAHGPGVWKAQVSVPPRSNRMGSPYAFVGKEVESSILERSVPWAEEKPCSLAFPEGMKVKLRKNSLKVTIELDSPEAAVAMFEQLVREAKKGN